MKGKELLQRRFAEGKLLMTKPKSNMKREKQFYFEFIELTVVYTSKRYSLYIENYIVTPRKDIVYERKQ